MNDDIDAIKMTREIREENYEKLKNKSNEEIILFFRNKSKQIMEELKNQTSVHTT